MLSCVECSYHIILYYSIIVLFYCIIFCFIILYNIMLYYIIILYWFILYYIISCFIISHYIISYYVLLYHIILFHFMIYIIMLYFIILCYIILCYIISYYVILYFTTVFNWCRISQPSTVSVAQEWTTGTLDAYLDGSWPAPCAARHLLKGRFGDGNTHIFDFVWSQQKSQRLNLAWFLYFAASFWGLPFIYRVSDLLM